jgi:hypothetical protein
LPFIAKAHERLPGAATGILDQDISKSCFPEQTICETITITNLLLAFIEFASMTERPNYETSDTRNVLGNVRETLMKNEVPEMFQNKV